jgi:hypothetical protein
MNKRYKKILLILISFLIVVGGWYWFEHPTDYRYSDRFVLGNTIDEITSKYGAFDKVFTSDTNAITHAGYVIQEERVGPLGTTYEKYYWIKFDINGKAIHISIEDGGWGG